MHTVGTPLYWTVFFAFVAAMLFLDLFVLHRKAHEIKFKEALFWSVVWIGMALIFNGWLYSSFGSEKGLEFLTAYFLEKALSVDNIFVFLMLFSFFKVPASLQHRVLFWGILGALAMRGVFIGAGAALVQSFHWILYLFGGLLLITGMKMLFAGEAEVDPNKNLIFRLFKKWVPSVSTYRGASFLVKEGGKWFATPLLLVLVAVEASDLLFAIDSIPAVFAVTVDPFIVYTSNIFAILGLRALYFLLSGAMQKLRYLKVGLSLVLCFIGGKMLTAGFYKIPIGVSLGVVALLIFGAVGYSLIKPLPEPEAVPEAD